MPVFLIFAPLAGLAASLISAEGTTVTFWRGLVPITFVLDPPAAMLLGVSSLLWTAASIYLVTTQHDRAADGQFAICWLLTLAGSIGVFVAGELASFFLAYTLVSIPAYGIIVHDDTPPVRRAGAIYIAYAVVGETTRLMAFALLAAATPGGRLSIDEVMAALPASPWGSATIALLILGFGMKIGLVPLHAWMPLTYRAAPIPAAAVLSGAGVKAGVIGMIRFLPLGTALPVAGTALKAVGLFGAFYGVAIGLTKANPKTVLAYSSVSQMGLIAAVLGMALTAGNAGAAVPTAFYAVHHVLVKGALFLAVGLAGMTSSRRWLLVLSPALVLALSLGGLPLIGGALAKLATKAVLGKGLIASLSDLSAAASTLLMMHFIHRLAVEPVPDRARATPLSLTASWLVLAVASVAIPWILYPLATGAPRASAFAPASVWASFWPVALGALLATLLYSQRDRLPEAPGDEPVGPVNGLMHATLRCAEVIAGSEREFRRWPVASLSLLVSAVLLGAAMPVAR
jgi:formate hydrogenlyase subunit 3/multisubunit Na+/H+ antiporter MnhD subunit